RGLAPDIPLVVVDNASTDSTALRIQRDFPDVTLVRADSNLGAAGRNLGVRAVTTRFVAFCDDDVCWLPDSLGKARAILDRHDDVAVLSARILVGASVSTDATCERMAISPLEGEPDVGPALTGFMAGACVVRVSAFESVGGYWAGLFIGGEESLMALDLLQQGWRILYAPQLQAWHCPSSLRDQHERERLLIRNALMVAWMRLPWNEALLSTKDALSALPSWKQRRQAILDTWRHYRLSGARRHPVGSDVRQMLRLVRRAEQTGDVLNHQPFP